jgi:hypothetical protein
MIDVEYKSSVIAHPSWKQYEVAGSQHDTEIFDAISSLWAEDDAKWLKTARDKARPAWQGCNSTDYRLIRQIAGYGGVFRNLVPKIFELTRASAFGGKIEFAAI